MKKIILLALSALIMVGCKESKGSEPTENSYKIIIIDSCEYIETRMEGYVNGTFPLHKNNCRFCKERRQKELEELVIKLKEE